MSRERTYEVNVFLQGRQKSLLFYYRKGDYPHGLLAPQNFPKEVVRVDVRPVSTGVLPMYAAECAPFGSIVESN